jgi:hypothetical protein
MDNSKWAEPCFCCQTQYVITFYYGRHGLCPLCYFMIECFNSMEW